MLVFIIRNWKNQITAILVLENYANKGFYKIPVTMYRDVPGLR